MKTKLILSLVLAGIILSLSACGNSEKKQTVEIKTGNTTTQQTTEAAVSNTTQQTTITTIKKTSSKKTDKEAVAKTSKIKKKPSYSAKPKPVLPTIKKHKETTKSNITTSKNNSQDKTDEQIKEYYTFITEKLVPLENELVESYNKTTNYDDEQQKKAIKEELLPKNQKIINMSKSFTSKNSQINQLNKEYAGLYTAQKELLEIEISIIDSYDSKTDSYDQTIIDKYQSKSNLVQSNFKKWQTAASKLFA